jgi:hypothetical protein
VTAASSISPSNSPRRMVRTADPPKADDDREDPVRGYRPGADQMMNPSSISESLRSPRAIRSGRPEAGHEPAPSVIPDPLCPYVAARRRNGRRWQ